MLEQFQQEPGFEALRWKSGQQAVVRFDSGEEHRYQQDSWFKLRVMASGGEGDDVMKHFTLSNRFLKVVTHPYLI